MSRRHYVLVGIDVPDYFAENPLPGKEPWAAAQLVLSLLHDALFVRDIDVKVADAITLSPENVDQITAALHHEVERGDETIRALDVKMTELRAAVDRAIAHRKSEADEIEAEARVKRYGSTMHATDSAEYERIKPLVRKPSGGTGGEQP